MQSRQQIPVARRKARWCLAIVPLLGALLTAPVSAQEIDSIELEPVEPAAAPRYAVELILFTYGDGVVTGNEVFPPDKVKAEPDPVAAGDEDIAFGDRPMPGASSMRAEPGDEPRVEPGLERGGEYSAGTGVEPESGPTTLEPLPLPADIGLVVMPREKLTLANAFDKLSELDAYRPVVWTGWTQTVYESDVTPVIRLRRLARIPLEFDGTLKLYLSRYLHLEVDLTMEDRQTAAPSADDRRFGSGNADTAWTEPQVRPTEIVHYRILEDRIVRNGELRYFDHPKFGLLARISRVTDDAEA
ncbi:MAG: CsiV family protein, partial [Woeseia sp.]